MHVRLRLLVGTLGSLAGCGFRAGTAQIDASADTSDADAPDAGPCVSWSALNIMPCNEALGAPRDLMLAAGAYVLDTDSGQLSGAMTQQLPGALIAQPSGLLMLRVVN